MPSEISVLVTLLGPGELLPATVPCLPGCFWALLQQTLSSLPCRQEDHTKRDGQGLRTLPHGQALALGWETHPGGEDMGRQGLIAYSSVPSFGAHQPLHVAPTAGH